LWYGDNEKIAYTQIILDKHFKLVNNLRWKKNKGGLYGQSGSEQIRSFPPVSESILFYSNEWDISSGEMVSSKAAINFALYLKTEFKRAKVTNREIAGLFPSKTGSLTGCVSNWLNGNNIITKEQYIKIRNFLNGNYLRKEYEDLRKEYEDLRKEYDYLRKEYDYLRRPFNNLGTLDSFYFQTEVNSKYNHDTPKPEKLTETLILTTSRKGDNVFVPFSGSGTECSMSAKTGRNFEGWDIKKKYVDMSNERAKEHLEQLRLF